MNTYIQKWFEQNYLDGDKIQDGQMLSSKECFQSITDYHNHIVEKIEKSINNWKVEIGEIPENTCPKIDKLIGQHKEILNDLNYLEKNKHKYETVDDIVKDFPGTYWDNVESIAEELRVSNEKLREIGKFWYENCKSIPPLLQDTNPRE